MKVFVCYKRVPMHYDEDCSIPLAAFSNQSSAEEWCKEKEKKSSWAFYEWEELEVQE